MKPFLQKLVASARQASAKGVVNEIFAHCRNLSIATLFIAAGGFVAENPPPTAPLIRFLNVGMAGYFVAGFGITLLLLNLVEGLHKLSDLRRALILDVVLIIFYVFLSLMLIQIIILFRTRHFL